MELLVIVAKPDGRVIDDYQVEIDSLNDEPTEADARAAVMEAAALM